MTQFEDVYELLLLHLETKGHLLEPLKTKRNWSLPSLRWLFLIQENAIHAFRWIKATLIFSALEPRGPRRGRAVATHYVHRILIIVTDPLVHPTFLLTHQRLQRSSIKLNGRTGGMQWLCEKHVSPQEYIQCMHQSYEMLSRCALPEGPWRQL